MSIAGFKSDALQAVIVDDDGLVRRLLRKWIEKCGFEVRLACDGQEAMQLLGEQPARLVVTDLEMPRVDGIQLIEWIRNKSYLQFTYVLTLTAAASSADMIRVLDAGANEFISKPVQREEFMARLRAARRIMELEQMLNQQARGDSLTGLLSQRSLCETARLEWARAERYGQPLSCVMLDIDYFKRVNDTYGHPIGDEIIRQFAAILKQSARKTDVVARYGGEEFCILLPGADEQQAFEWADRVRKLIRSSPFLAGKNLSLPVSASFGVAQRLRDTSSIETLIDMADQALLVAKRSGRDRVLAFRQLEGPPLEAPSETCVDRFGSLTAGEVMTTIISPLRREMTLGAAIDYLLDFRLSSLPVVDPMGKLCGYLSEKDCLGVMLESRWRERPVAEVMKTSVVHYDESTPVRQIFEFLNRVSIRSVVVVRNGRPVGSLSRAAMLRWFSLTLATGAKPTTAASLGSTGVLPEIQAISSRLAADASLLQERLRLGAADPLACLIGGVSQIQERVNDLLSASSKLNQRGDTQTALGADFCTLTDADPPEF